MKVTIYHNPKCQTSRNVLALIREKGIEPTIIEYLKTPLTRAEIAALVKMMGSTSGSVVSTVRDIVRAKEPLYAELKLDKASDSELLDAMAKHAILLNRPIVTTPKGTKLCRPSESVDQIL